MADKSFGDIVILSIKPEYAQAIISGEKTVEFRRRPLRDKVKFAIVYATFPIQKVLGVFRIKKIEKRKVRGLWRTYKDQGSISKDKYTEYFQGTDYGFAIVISSCSIFKNPIELTKISPKLRPPQSYMYLPEDCHRSFSRLVDTYADVPLAA